MKTDNSDLLEQVNGVAALGLEKIKEAAFEATALLRQHADDLKVKASGQFSEGRKALTTAEEYVVETVRKNPGLFAGIAVGIAATLVAGVLFARSRRS